MGWLGSGSRGQSTSDRGWNQKAVWDTTPSCRRQSDGWTATSPGSLFQQMVWGLLRQIPYGTTITYGELAARAAEQLGRSGMSAQAVGGAVARNPISILVPCHRVVGADGSLTGYAGGLERKRQLLALEGANDPSHD